MDFIFLRGHKRSGNHLFVNWLMSLYGKTKFYNSFLKLPFEIPSDEVAARLEEFIQCYRSIPKGIRDNYEAVICTTELPQHWNDRYVARLFEGMGGNRQFSFYLIRDPFNWMSSFLRIYKKDENMETVYREEKDRMWNWWLKTYFEWKQADHPINYNLFVSSLDYRQYHTSLLGKVFDIDKDKTVMETLATHPAVWKPSSFDDGIPPKEMKIFERYKVDLDLYNKYGIPEEVQQIALIEWGLRL